MSLSEAARHVERIRSDPASALAAELEGWDYPVSRLEAILMDLWDLEAAKSGAKKPPRYTRPWKSPGQQTKRGDAAGRTAEQVLDLLRPQAPV